MIDLHVATEVPHRAHLALTLQREEQEQQAATQELPSSLRTTTANESDTDEMLVEDQRENLSPAQHVEQRLVAMLRTAPVFVSHMQKDSRPRYR